MRFYVSKCHNTLHGMPYNPELKTPNLCLNPYYKVKLLPGCDVSYILDSGAFQDVRGERLSFADALRRQLGFEETVGRPAYAVVSYDRLVMSRWSMELRPRSASTGTLESNMWRRPSKPPPISHPDVRSSGTGSSF